MVYLRVKKKSFKHVVNILSYHVVVGKICSQKNAFTV